MGVGYLSVQVNNGNDSLPVTGATVNIINNNNELLYQLATDLSGKTEKVSLKTVDSNLANEPNYTGNPYETYQLEVTANGYNSVIIHGIRIFDGEHAIQPVTLIPLLASQNTITTYDINISPPSIQSPSQREQDGPMREPRVLRHVVIPDPITVHLGAPSSQASNIKTSFINYVKNVACSEIYPTWPKEALKANIYAITSFALNRVFTEWYPSRGYNFDITNSTAYDQYFVYGQTIYESISSLVDEQFNQYVTRIGSTAPFFTSFCNGTTATCKGLSQWGTVTLANKGQKASDILKYYYGNQIEIAETNLITSILTSYPGYSLRLGSIGLDVQTIQTYLKRIRKNYPAIPAINDEEGSFGTSTQNAVKQFQKIFNLVADGIVGKATWNQISRIFVSVTRLSELDAEGDALGVGTVPPISTLRVGNSGRDVITLQFLLNYISLYFPSIVAPSQNGNFDTDTYSSLIGFQQMLGLTPDGIVGRNTWNSLYEIYWGIKNNVITPPPNPDYIQYIVVAGDSLWLIANRYQTTVDEIMKLNQLTSTNIFVGQILNIPSTNNVNYFEYTIVAGDTLWLLSKRFHTTVDKIRELNNLCTDNLTIGQILKIPQN